MKTFILRYFLADGNVITLVTSNTGRKKAAEQVEPMFQEMLYIRCMRRKINVVS